MSDLMNQFLAMLSLQNTNKKYTFYYDETNNIRRLHLTNAGFNVPDPACFLLGGVGHDGPPRSIDLSAIRSKLNLQSSMTEMKLKHLAKGDFLALIKSSNLLRLLDWIETEGLFIHYQVTDPLYWSIIDVIDSIASNGNIGFDIFQLRTLKNTLYNLLRSNISGMSDLMIRYNYPNVGNSQKEFLNELIKMVESHLDIIDEDDIQVHGSYMMLKGTLQMGRTESLAFLENEDPHVLIKGFGFMYANRIQTFAKSEHILDKEHSISEYLKTGVMEGQAISYRFVDSKDEEGVQLSDVIVGLLGKAFTYCTHHSIEEIEQDLQNLSDHQSKALSTITRMLDLSTDRSNAFAQRILSNDDEAKAHLLFDPNRR